MTSRKTVLVTGAAGFVGRNLLQTLSRRPDVNALAFDVEQSRDDLRRAVENADFIFHFAGVNRPPAVEDFEKGNTGLTRDLIALLESARRSPWIVFSSSILAAGDTPYGLSKRRAEELLAAFAARSRAPVRLLRLPNVFGKWCRPNYNSVVATFCHHIAHDLPIEIHDPARRLELVYIDDVVQACCGFLDAASAPEPGCCFHEVAPVYTLSVGELAEKIRRMRDIRPQLTIPDFSDRFLRCLHATYLSYLEPGDMAWNLDQKRDNRGVLAEFLKSPHVGQLFLSRTRPGITRGNHYHDTKVEKFFVVEGQARIRLRHVQSREVLAFDVSGTDFRIVDIPPGYAHSIENTGASEMIVLFWTSEVFHPQTPDTYPCEVKYVQA